MSQKRVVVVLTSLVGTLTVSAGLLLAMEGLPLNTTPSLLARPGSSVVLDTQVPLQAGAWSYIIIYESGPVADAASLAEGRLQGGSGLTSNATRPGAGFHFVVDGNRGTDGELKVGSAWLRQDTGAPYAGWPVARYNHYSPYNNAVGVCLVGDSAKQPVSSAQYRTLVDLTRELKDRLNIQPSKVLFQWELEPNVARMTASQKAFADQFRKALD